MDNWLKKGKNWVEYIYITEELGKKTIGIAIKRILTLLESAKILLEQGGDPTISAGIYTYAVEEYGKIVLLRESPRINGKLKNILEAAKTLSQKSLIESKRVNE